MNQAQRRLLTLTQNSFDAVTFILAFALAIVVTNHVAMLEQRPQSHGILVVALALVPVAQWLRTVFPVYGLNCCQRVTRHILTALILFTGFLCADYVVSHPNSTKRLIFGITLCTVALPALRQNFSLGYERFKRIGRDAEGDLFLAPLQSFSLLMEIEHTGARGGDQWLHDRLRGISAHPDRFCKLLLDYALGIPLFLASVPVLIVLAALVILVSPGNPLYCQVREGYAGKRIKVWKLRTMYPRADELLQSYLDANPEAKEEWQTYFKLKNDPRILRGIGNFLRKTSLDELPQLWNVLCGEMSLVGPRPFPHYHLQQFGAHFRRMRRTMKPGMTGLWQVSARSDGDLSIQETLDTTYIRNWSLWLDLVLLARTVSVVVNRKGAY